MPSISIDIETDNSQSDGYRTSQPMQLQPHDYQGYDHITWYVGNAKQAASYFVTRFGFQIVAYRGLETGSRAVAGYVVANGAAKFVFLTPIRGLNDLDETYSAEDKALVREIYSHLEKHGDAVKDVAFQVNDVAATYDSTLVKGAVSVTEVKKLEDDAGHVLTATIKTYGDTVHTFVQRDNYYGAFLPGYKELVLNDPINDILRPISIVEVDHCVGNQDWDELANICELYWTVDDRNLCSEYSAMNSVVMSSPQGIVKMPINEPALGKKVSQIEEYVRFNGGPGVQHIAFRTENILETVRDLKKRGVPFITVPSSYYDGLRKRLATSAVSVEEDIADLQNLSILLDFDEGGYLLQIFTKPLLDRPTVFLEIIQRENFDGFGAGNFKSLFEAVEREQAERGTL
ncbi:hypothetical protein N0V94_005618 [Neodidymelliopsis sp. IMI 364377]|nr:hypothetical protein N0V94_005618 [Neodidymelliopsis sp. IMI 364377]